MFCRNRRRSVGRVTPSFVRNLRKGYLQPNGEPLPGKEREARTLLSVLHCLQEGKYIRAVTIAHIGGFDLEKMYRDYSRMVANTGHDFNKFLEGVEAFCKKYTTSMFVGEGRSDVTRSIGKGKVTKAVCKRCKKAITHWLFYWADKDGWLRCGKDFLPHEPKTGSIQDGR